ncbi:DUF6515 family protein [Sediminitomix flava]|uniref:Uncharacterized protein n=1 Tax=Sediminitomix flava TaxID=379075 RepID=A0A315Z2M2_SEDFL|nr:DUF6515 family protein [Sediminitomix flava]PWJ36036.1 hypothetical protein BC781_10950 [Sediminitomix flava]
MKTQTHKLGAFFLVWCLLLYFSPKTEAQYYRSGIVITPRACTPYFGFNYGYNFGYNNFYGYNRPSYPYYDNSYYPYDNNYYTQRPPKKKKIKEISEYAQLYEWQGNSYYYDGEQYYRQIKKNRYELAEAPIGMKIYRLPIESQEVMVGEELYYQSGNTYYKPIDLGNETVYEIVSSPSGNIFDKLPEGAKAIIRNGENLYEYDGKYYKAVVRDNQVKYQQIRVAP